MLLALGASLLFLAQAGEMFASKEGCWDDGHILRRGDFIFFRGSIQLNWTTWGQVDRVEVRFRSSKGDQLWDGTVMTRARADPPLPLRDGGGAVELMIELLSSCVFLSSHGRWRRLVPRVMPGQSGRRRGRQLPFAERWCWRDCRRMSTRCTPCVLGAPPSCRRGGGVSRCSTERREMEVGCI